ncbi:MAG: hypothetical protein ACHQ51_14990 [Elusimicrobiota bacterium]
MRLALIEDSHTAITTTIDAPLERVLREAGADAELKGVDVISCTFSGPDHTCRLPAGLGAPATDASSLAVALESESGIAFVYPPDPDLVAALKKAAADPSTFHQPYSLRLQELDADAAAHVDARGGTTLTLSAEFDRPTTRRFRAGLAGYYRIRWKGHDTAVILPGRAYGSLGRLAAAADAADAPFLGVARGGTFGSLFSDAQGRIIAEALEKAGLRWSAVGNSEIEHWTELQDYRREHPNGIQYLSANLVYSTQTDRTVLPAYAVYDASGTRVALVGLTPDSTADLLPRAGLGRLQVKDPVLAVEALIARLHSEADIVVALSDLGPAETARLAAGARGLDLILADSSPRLIYSPPPALTFVQNDRPTFANPLPPMRAYQPAFNVYEIDRRLDEDRANWKVTSSALLLDESVNPLEGFPEHQLTSYFTERSTETPLIPAARDIFSANERPMPFYYAREFWTLSAGLLAERGRAEAGLLPDTPLTSDALGGVRESLVREWLGPTATAIVVSVPGARLKALAKEAAEQKSREDADLPVDAKMRFTVSGFDSHGLLRGAPVDAASTYRVATSRLAAETLGLPEPYDLIAGTPTVASSVLEELRARGPEAGKKDWRGWLEGAPLSERALWRINFRDIGLNLRQTKVRSSDSFNAVQNSRVQGSDELLIGGVLKTDAEYLHHEYKWTNTLEMEYAKDRISPRNGPATTNLAANRIMFLTLDTKRVGGIPYGWLARSWGPSVGLQYDGEFQSSPGLPRKQVYSVFPGVEFFDGSVVKTLSTSGILKRDLSRDPPNTQTGLRLRTLLSTPLGPGGAKLDGELWSNYFFLTHSDNASDLRLEGDASAKLSIPIRKHLSVAPFVDFYWFGLKTSPSYGYSLMTGISIGFSRIWKPQYEDF